MSFKDELDEILKAALAQPNEHSSVDWEYKKSSGLDAGVAYIAERFSKADSHKERMEIGWAVLNSFASANIFGPGPGVVLLIHALEKLDPVYTEKFAKLFLPLGANEDAAKSASNDLASKIIQVIPLP